MIAALALCVFMQTPPSPLDGFRANLASTKAQLDYHFQVGEFQGEGWKPWDEPMPPFAETIPDDRVVGRWACDGQTEYYSFASPPDVLERAAKDELRYDAGKVFYNVRFVPKTEFLWNGEIQCWHSESPHVRGRKGGDPRWSTVRAERIESNSLFRNVGGPFLWGFGAFPHELAAYDGVTPERRRCIRYERPLDVEIYKRSGRGDGWLQLEVFYDSQIGYLPRFVRSLSYDARADRCTTFEFFLKEARPCAAGGFVPWEWYNWFFQVERFGTKFPKYQYTDRIGPAPAVKGFAHYKADRLRSLAGPVALTDLAAVRSVRGVGGEVRLDRRPASLTLSEVTALLGKRLWMPPATRVPPLPIDLQEARRFDPVNQSSGQLMYRVLSALSVAVGCACAALWVLSRRRRHAARRPLLLIGCLILVGGCGKPTQPIAKIAGAYDNPIVYLPAAHSAIDMQLALRNDGNVSLRLEKVDGGCTCRKVDQSSLPAILLPGGIIRLPVAITSPRATGPHASRFDVLSDQGMLSVGASFVTLLDHEFEPQRLANTQIGEEESWTFALKHRFIGEGGPNPSAYKMAFPAGFRASVQAASGGSVSFAPKYHYAETVYRVNLEDRSFGRHSAAIELLDMNGKVARTIPVLWERVPYLSSIPTRVQLGKRPARVFLRCQDESVELTKVVSVPSGIEAVVSSPREVTVTLRNGASNIIDGWVEVQTTSESAKPLRFQVVRYAPDASEQLGVDRAER
jgi:hypothetical protein